MSDDQDALQAQNGPPTYEEATNLPRGPSTRETTPLLENQRHIADERPSHSPGHGQTRNATSRSTGSTNGNASEADDYDLQGVVRFWLGLSYADAQPNSCSGYASLCCRFVFVLLLIWGIIIIVLTVVKSGGEKFYDACSELFTAILLTYLGGLSFILCFLYCMCVHLRECCRGRQERDRNRTGRGQRCNFTVCGTLALMVLGVFIAVLGGLVTWIGEHSNYVIYGCNNEPDSGHSNDSSEDVLCTCQREIGEIDSPFYMLPLWTAGSMTAITFVCVVVNLCRCCVAVCGCRRRRRRYDPV